MCTVKFVYHKVVIRLLCSKNLFLPILNPLAPGWFEIAVPAPAAPLVSTSPNIVPVAPTDSTPSVFKQTWKGFVLEHTVLGVTSFAVAPFANVYCLVVAVWIQLKMLFHVSNLGLEVN